MTERTFAEGLAEGRDAALHRRVDKIDIRLDAQARRLELLERIIWGLCGIIVFLEFLPVLKNFMGVLA